MPQEKVELESEVPSAAGYMAAAAAAAAVAANPPQAMEDDHSFIHYLPEGTAGTAELLYISGYKLI